MIRPLEIQIFVSNPRDVEKEKKIIEDVCARINTTLELNNCSVRYFVKEWKKLILKFGVNAQTEIENSIKEYDIYIGIMWKKYGSDVGAINPQTGSDYGSGTVKEFFIAYDSFKRKGVPTMYMYFKDQNNGPLSDLDLDELRKVSEFRKSQETNGFCYRFKNKNDFKDKITDLLYQTALNLCDKAKKQQKQEVYEKKEITLEFALQDSIEQLPSGYIFRTVSDLVSAEFNDALQFKRPQKQTLEELLHYKNKIVLLGDAGSGKSTELLNLFYKLKEEDSPYFPIFQKLNTITSDRGLDDFLPTWWNQVQPEIVVIIWDGLDEVLSEQFNEVVRKINYFSQKNPKIKVVISCRANFYELPVNNSPGTLPDFAPYILDALNHDSIKHYYSFTTAKSNGEDFIAEMWNRDLLDLASRPFFLSIICSHYNKENKLPKERVFLFDMYIQNRMRLDEMHFKGVYDIRINKVAIIKTLQKIAIAMEIMSKNIIHESEILEILTVEEFSRIKYSTTFTKRSGKDNLWQFEHNNIQEYFAACVLQSLDFNVLVKLITFKPSYKKVIPTWVNTLTFLFSILKETDSLFIQLLEWLLDNDKELIVRFERHKIPEDIRSKIFWGIFNYYKERNVWLSSNKFSVLDLATFGQSSQVVRAILNEIEIKNSETIKLNSIQILSHFNFSEYSQDIKNKSKSILINQIALNLDKSQYVHSCIDALCLLDFTDKNTIDQVLTLVGEMKNQSIRSSVYSLLMHSEVLDDYVDYIIEGYRIKIGKYKEDRAEFELMNEGWNLKKCVKNIKKPASVRKIFQFFTTIKEFSHHYDRKDILIELINKMVEAYEVDMSLYDLVLNWFIESIRRFRSEVTDIAYKFFVETETCERAARQILMMSAEKADNRWLAIAKLASPAIMNEIIDRYRKHDITNTDIEEIYFDMGWMKNDHIQYFEELIETHTSIRIKKPQFIDHEAIRTAKIIEEFNLLFNYKQFTETIIGVFDGESKIVLEFDELFEIMKGRRKGQEMDDIYSGVALRFLREFKRGQEPVMKEEVVNWLSNKANERGYVVHLMHEYLSDHQNIIPTPSQRRWICTWVKENIQAVDFTTAITVKNVTEINIKLWAIYIWYFVRKFNISLQVNYYLDMISFDNYEGRSHEMIGIDYLKPLLPKVLFDRRVLDNIKQGISYFPVLENHVEYILENSLRDGYEHIVNHILNLNFEEYKRKSILEMYFSKTNDIGTLKDIIHKVSYELHWWIVDVLKETREASYIESYVLERLKVSTEVNEQRRAAQVLVKMHNVTGLNFYIELLENDPTTFIDEEDVLAFRSVKDIKVLPYLSKLLNVSYRHTVPTSYFNDFNSIIVEMYYNIAFLSDENFVLVIDELQGYVYENAETLVNAKNLIYTIERMSSQYYLNKAQAVGIDEVKGKLALIASVVN